MRTEYAFGIFLPLLAVSYTLCVTAVVIWIDSWIMGWP